MAILKSNPWKPTMFLLVWTLLQAPAAVFSQTEEQVTMQEETEPDDQEETEPDYYAELPFLRQYVGEALECNPSIQEALARYRAALERASRVTALPDPVFGFSQAIRSVETRVGPQHNSFAFTQAFPWFGTLDLRGKVAVEEAASWYQLYRARQREVISQIKRAFYELSYIDAAIQINEEERSLLEHYEALAETRYATGQGLQQAVIKIQAEITRVTDRLEVLDRQRSTLSANINTLVDRPPDDPIPAVERLSLPQVQLDLEELYALGEKNRQELKAAQALIERSERSIDLAKKSYWPDFMVSAGLVNIGARGDPAGIAQPPPDNGKNAFSLSVGISIPIWRDKYDAGVEAAAETLSAQRWNYVNVLNQMEFSIRDQVIRLETLQQQVDLYEDVLIPQAEESLRSTEAAYQTGQLGVLDLLDSERVLLNARLVNARYDSDFLVALAHLERAVGTKFPE
jgi:cobalt-zinc-cadmium efflux system outer membrane protein